MECCSEEGSTFFSHDEYCPRLYRTAVAPPVSVASASVVRQRPRVDLDSLLPSGSMARDPGWGPGTQGCGRSDWPVGAWELLTHNGMPTKTSLTPGWGHFQPLFTSLGPCYTPFSFLALLLVLYLSYQLDHFFVMFGIETKGVFLITIHVLLWPWTAQDGAGV